MNPNDNPLSRLIDEVLPSAAADIGPSRTALLAMVRRRRARRQWGRGGVAAALLLGLSALLWPDRDASQEAMTVADAPAPPPQIVVEQVSDEQLLALLKDTPAALMEWPNGDRTLLVVER